MKCYLAHPVTDYGGSARQVRADRTIEAETREACAKLIEAECERILSKQSDNTDPFSINDTIDQNLRLMAAVLPDLATAIRAAGKDTA